MYSLKIKTYLDKESTINYMIDTLKDRIIRNQINKTMNIYYVNKDKVAILRDNKPNIFETPDGNYYDYIYIDSWSISDILKKDDKTSRTRIDIVYKIKESDSPINMSRTYTDTNPFILEYKKDDYQNNRYWYLKPMGENNIEYIDFTEPESIITLPLSNDYYYKLMPGHLYGIQIAVNMLMLIMY
jgi:hypothetical protein